MSWLQNKLSNYSLSSNSEIVNLTINNIKNSTEYIGYAKVYFPDTPTNIFLPILAVDSYNNTIRNSNSYLNDINYSNFNNICNYDQIYKIFSSLQIIKDNIQSLEVIDTVEEPMFLLCNPFSGRNSGHDLSILFDKIHWYKTHNLNIPIVLGETMFQYPFTLDICKILLKDIPIYILKKNTVVIFQHLIVVPNIISNIMKHKYLHDDIIQYCIQNSDNIDKYKNKKVCLIKNLLTNTNITNSHTGFTSETLLSLLEKQYDYIIINPEKIDTVDLVLYLYYASKVLVSFGSIMYTNCIFFNKSADLYYICTEHTQRLTPYFEDHRYKYVVTNEDLDTDIDNILKKIGEKI
jgi:hypothetical protein